MQVARAEVLLIGVPMPGLLLSSAGLYDRLAEELGLAYDGKSLSDILADRDLKADPIHPNAAGYRKLAERLRDVLRRNGAI